MLLPTSLILLLFVALVFSHDSPEKKLNNVEVNQLYSEEAKEAMVKLQEELNTVHTEFKRYSKEFEHNNDLLTAVKEYREEYAATKNTECADAEPPDDDDDDLIMFYMADCANKLPTNMLKDFSDVISAAKAGVKEIDKNLKATCTSNPSSCDEERNKATKELNDILTPELDAQLKSDASDLVDTFKTDLHDCFENNSKELREGLIEATKDMKECFAIHSSS